MRSYVARAARCMILAAACPLAGCFGSLAPPLPPPGAESLGKGNVSAREQLVVAQLRAVAAGQQFYFARNGEYATIDELVEAGMLNHTPEAVGYTIELTVEEGGGGYALVAVPEVYGPDGRRSFYMDESGVVRGADHEGGAPEPTDPPV